MKLLACFSCDKVSGLIFPWAECNLRELFAQELPAHNRSSTPCWVLQQTIGLMAGLSAFHNLRNDKGKVIGYARHGDLHPENMLLLKILDDPAVDRERGTLQIAGTSMAKMFTDSTGYDVPLDTGMYDGPECQLNITAGPIYDIWSMGCIFLELIMWLFDGPQSLQRFALDRLDPDPLYGGAVHDDYFFTMLVQDNSIAGATLRPSVKACIERLKQHPLCNETFDGVLEFIEDAMLRTEASQRLTAEDIVCKLETLVNK